MERSVSTGRYAILTALVTAGFAALVATAPVGGTLARRDILIITERPDAARVLTGQGFSLRETTRLDGVGKPLLRVTPPATGGGAAAVTRLRRALPEALIATNGTVVLTSAAPGGPVDLATASAPRPGTCGAGIRLGMIDTRVDAAHETLRTREIVRQSFLEADAVPAPVDHGTAIASLLVGDPAESIGGLLPGATLYVAEVFRRKADGSLAADLYAVLKALDWLIEQRVSVVNMSFETIENPVLSLILGKAAGEGLMLVAAAGNGGPRAAPAYPAAHPAVLAVTAVDRQARAYRYANHGSYIDFSALGVGVRTAAANGFQVQSGTSFAVPAITAAVAGLLRRGLTPDPALIRETLRGAARDLGAPGRDDVYGWGVLNVDVCAGSGGASVSTDDFVR